MSIEDEEQDKYVEMKNRPPASSLHKTYQVGGKVSPNSGGILGEVQETVKNTISETESNPYLTARKEDNSIMFKGSRNSAALPSPLQTRMFQSQREAFIGP